MKIEKILNNNAVLSHNNFGEEVIVKGKGIAFNSSAGDRIDEKKIQKTFVLENKDTSSKYQELLKTIPLDCVDTTEEVIDFIKSTVNKPISDKIYVTLTDHIVNLLERLSLGITFDNSLLWDVKRMYHEEYKAGVKALAIIRKNFDIDIPDEEGSFIALHIVNAEMNVAFEDVYKITSMITDIYEIVKERLDIRVNENSLDYSRFIMHLRFFLERTINNTSSRSEKNKEALEIMASQFPAQYNCVQAINNYVSEKFDKPVEGEQLFLMIHILKLTTN